jgi:hypothetical protein
VGTHDLFGAVALALATGGEPPAPLEQLWEGLEAFPAYDDEVEPATLATATTEALGIAPEHSGLVDHARIGDEWERTGGRTSDHRQPSSPSSAGDAAQAPAGADTRSEREAPEAAAHPFSHAQGLWRGSS